LTSSAEVAIAVVGKWENLKWKLENAALSVSVHPSFLAFLSFVAVSSVCVP